MPDETPVILQPGTLGYDCYPADPQELNVAIITGARAFLAETYPGIYVGNTAPPANQRNRLWFNTDSSKWYQYVNGGWMRHYQYPAEPDPNAVPGFEALWGKSEAELNVFDGGDAGAVGDFTGPLWLIDRLFDGRAIVGAGTIPGTDPAVTILQNATSDSDSLEGAYKTALVPANFQHYHGCGTDGNIDDPPTMISRAWSSVKNFVRRINDLTAGGSGWHDDTTAFGSGTMGTTEPYQDPNYPDSDPHFNMQPYRARYVIKRSARIWVNAPF